MKLTFLAIAMVMFANFAFFAQSSVTPPPACTLRLANAPEVRGVRLGMTVDELFTLFPGSSDSGGIKDALSHADGFPNFGESRFSIAPSNWGNKDHFAGINDYNLQLFDRRVVYFVAYYAQFPFGARWRNQDELIQRFSDALHLPGPKEWVPDPDGGSRKKLKCHGFEVYVTAGDGATITF